MTDLYFNSQQVLDIVLKVLDVTARYPDSYNSPQEKKTYVSSVINSFHDLEVTNLPGAEYTIVSGKHTGKTIGAIYLCAASYLAWALGNYEPGNPIYDNILLFSQSLESIGKKSLVPAVSKSQVLTEFQQDCLKALKYGDFELTFGKHKNKTFADVWEKDPQYFAYLKDKGNDNIKDTVLEFLSQVEQNHFDMTVMDKKKARGGGSPKE